MKDLGHGANVDNMAKKFGKNEKGAEKAALVKLHKRNKKQKKLIVQYDEIVKK